MSDYEQRGIVTPFGWNFSRIKTALKSTIEKLKLKLILTRCFSGFNFCNLKMPRIERNWKKNWKKLKSFEKNCQPFLSFDAIYSKNPQIFGSIKAERVLQKKKSWGKTILLRSKIFMLRSRTINEVEGTSHRWITTFLWGLCLVTLTSQLSAMIKMCLILTRFAYLVNL